MDSYFFRVEHDLLRSESFKGLGGSAIKVYLVIGLYSDFGTGWAYPSIRTIAKQAGLSRQTVLAAVAQLTRAGLLATSKSQGRSTAYRIIRQAPRRPAGRVRGGQSAPPEGTGPESCAPTPATVPESFDVEPRGGPGSLEVLAQFLGPAGPERGPKREPGTREDTTNIPIPGTPFRLTADGRLLVSVDLQELLTDQGLPKRLAEKLATQRAPEDVAKVLLNALYLKSQGKLQNEVGYIRAGLEGGYDLLPQVAHRLESRRRELLDQQRANERRRQRIRIDSQRKTEEEAVRLMLEAIPSDRLQAYIDQAVASLPMPLVRRNPTLSNPFVRAKVYELVGGEPDSEPGAFGID
jgi:hypothetical protein